MPTNMAIPYNPSQAGVDFQANKMSTGMTREGYGNEGLNLFSGGRDFTEAFVESTIMYNYVNDGKAGDYFLHNYFKTFGAMGSMPVFGTEHSWFEMDRTRYGMTIGTIGAGTGTPSLIVTAAASPSQNAFLVGDVLNSVRLGGMNVRIDVVNEAVTPYEYTLRKLDGTNWTVATDLAVGDMLGLSHNVYAQESGQPKGRQWRPYRRTNKLGILKATSEVGGSAYTTKTGLTLPGGSMVWAYANHMYMMMEFFKSRENSYMWAQETADNAPEVQGRGIFHSIFDNSANGIDYGATLEEADFRQLIERLNLENGGSRFVGIGGHGFRNASSDALKAYTVNGGVDYGSFGINKTMAAGLNITQYNVTGTLLEFGKYNGFSDVHVTGASATAPIATAMDFSNFALFINMDNGGGTVTVDNVEVKIPYATHVYRALGDVDRSLVIGSMNGMTGKSNSIGGGNLGGLPEGWAPFLRNMVNTDVDKDAFFVLSEVGVRLACEVSAHGYMRKSA